MAQASRCHFPPGMDVGDRVLSIQLPADPVLPDICPFPACSWQKGPNHPQVTEPLGLPLGALPRRGQPKNPAVALPVQDSPGGPQPERAAAHD